MYILCIFTYVYMYTVHIYHMLDTLYMNSNSKHGKSHMSLPVPVHTLKLLVYKHINSQEYTDHIIHTCLYEPMLCKLTFLFVPLRVLTLRTSLYTCIYPQVYLNCRKDTFVQEPTMRKLTYVCALASAHN